MIYLDYAATSPMSEEAMNVYKQVAEQFYGNPSSLHDNGSDAARILESSRNTLASLLSATPSGLYFTGSGSEATFLALSSLARAHREKGNHIIISDFEHSSVRNTATWMEENGFEVTRVKPRSDGRLDSAEVKKLIRNETILASIQHVNSETGVIQDLNSLGAVFSEHGVIFHSDCVQSFCKMEIHQAEWNLDAITISAHKVYGPKGTGACWINPMLNMKAVIPGVTQERGFRMGTVDVPSVAAFAAASKHLADRRETLYDQIKKIRTDCVAALREAMSDEFTIEEHNEFQSPYILGLRLHSMEGQYAMLECNRYNIGISTGSACQVGEQTPPAMMKALGRTDEEARQFIRLSFGIQTSTEDVEKAAGVIADVNRTQLAKLKY
jgi:cysteine desulfurase